MLHYWGISKSLCLSSKKKHVTIQLPEHTTLTQPSSLGNTWSMIADHDGFLDFGGALKIPYLYYEYDGSKVQFISNMGGYFVKKIV